MLSELLVDAVEASDPVLIAVEPAASQPGFPAGSVLHAGPPFADGEQPGDTVTGAITGALLAEGWAPRTARAALAAGDIGLGANQDHGFAAPLAGVVTGSMPVLVVDDLASGTRAAAPLNEGLGRVLRFGAFDDEVIDRLTWMRETLGPVLDLAVRRRGGVSLRPIMAAALRQGDELHNRNRAATAALVRELAPEIVRAAPGRDAARVLEFLRGNDHFFLNVCVAACKCIVDASFGAAPPGVITAMASNGRSFGIKATGTGGDWITTAAPVPVGRFDTGFGPGDASPLLGDSGLTEVLGFGGMALIAAPDVLPYLGATHADAASTASTAEATTVARHRSFTFPDGRGVPFGIHVERALASTVRPAIDAGIAHRLAGVGQIGAGLAPVPAECLRKANSLVQQPHACPMGGEWK